MNIESDEAQKIAGEIAFHAGESPVSAVLTAPGEGSDRPERQANLEEQRARIDEIVRRSLPAAPGVTGDRAGLHHAIGLPK